MTVTRRLTTIIPRITLALLILFPAAAIQARIATPTLDPQSIPKYVDPLVIPPAMPRTYGDRPMISSNKPFHAIDYYEIAVRQFKQQVLPSSLPKTTVWGYGSVNHPNTFNYPAFTIEAQVNHPVRVKWINQLVDRQGNFLPHLLPVDPTLHWANPPGPQTDTRDLTTSAPYRGPVPIVTHLHGITTTEESDGFTEAWYLPDAKNIPSGYLTRGTYYEAFRYEFFLKYGLAWEPGTATFQYPNAQRANTDWYHDHTLGITRLNVYTGMAGFYLLRGGSADLPRGVLPGPAPQLGDPAGKCYYEIPMAIQDRSFNADGSLFYPNSRAFFDGFTGPFLPNPRSDISPIWNPEFFGNTMVVNGKTWPKLNIEPRRYRFRLLNGCNSRTLILKLVAGNPANPAVRSGRPATAFWQIGNEGGFLPAPVQLIEVLMGPAERADVIVDFTGFRPGTRITMINRGPDAPFNGSDDPEADPATTGQVMQFTIVPLASRDTSIPPAQLRLPPVPKLGPANRVRQLSLNEQNSALLVDANGQPIGPARVLLGVVRNGTPIPRHWDDAITEYPKLGDTEIWELYNFTADAHPIHVHEVQFEVLDRTPMGVTPGGPKSQPANPWERGNKDTVLAYPGQITRIKAKFDLLGLFVWHCHILEHEDNEMMRPYRVIP